MYDSSDSETSSSSRDSNPWLTEQLKQCTDVNDFQTHCDVCNRTMNKGQFISHVKGNPHRNEMEKLLENHQIESVDTDHIYYCELCDSYTDNFMAHINSNVDHKNWRWINGAVNKDNLKYYVYDTAEASAEAENYRAIHRTMLTYNYIRKLNDIRYFCEPCQLNLTLTSEISHMFGQRHTSGLQDYQQRRKL